jgi:prefoldin subunit 5
MYVRVTNTDFVRDIDSMGLSNTNVAEKNEYYAKVRMIKSQKEEINKVKSEIDSLKEDVNDIKQLLNKILENQING